MSMQKKIDQFISILCMWNNKINLIQKNTFNDITNRHILDSLQIKELIPTGYTALDIGSGAGFPGVILSIYGMDVILCEKNFKKVVFLKEIKRKLGLNYKIFANDIYNFPDNMKNLIAISRAFAPLYTLIRIMQLKQISIGIFHKGKTYQKEIQKAQALYNFQYKLIPSVTNIHSRLIKITLL